MLRKLKVKLRERKGMSTLEFVICMLIFIMVTAFIVDLFIVSYKHYVVAANCTKSARVIAIQGGLGNRHPENYPGEASNYMTNREFKTYLDELANTVQGDVGEFRVYLDYSYIDNYDNVIEKENILIYQFAHDESGAVSNTYFPQDFLLPYGSFINLKFEYTYEFFYTNIWFDRIQSNKFHSTKSYVTEYVSYDYGYHINGQKILTVIENLPPLNNNVNVGATATNSKYFTFFGNAITGLSPEGQSAEITDLVIPTHIDGNHISRIADNAFKNCTTFTSVTIPSNITTIGANAFDGCTNLATVRYYEGLERIDASAFANCGKLMLFAPAYSYVDMDAVNGIASDRIILPESLQEVRSKAFENCAKIKIVRIGKNVVKLANDAFNGTNASGINLYFEHNLTYDASGNEIYPLLGYPWKTSTNPTNVDVAWGQPRKK